MTHLITRQQTGIAIVVFCMLSLLANTLYAEVRARGIETTLVGIVTVKAIDIDSRQVTLDAGGGQTSVITVGEEARNLERIKVGDVVVVEYYEGLVIGLTPGGDGTTSRGVAELFARAKKGDKPAAKVVKIAKVQAVVEDIDRANRIVILRGVDRAAAFKVGNDINLANVNKGDVVHIDYVEGYAVSVQPPADVVAEVDISSKSVSLIVGADWGKGTLKLRDGSTHKLKVSGLSLGGIGVAKLQANGYVYDLKDIRDIEGTYRALRFGLTVAEGGSSAIMKNSKGVKIRMETKEKGAKLSLGPQGLKIQLVE